MAIPNADDIHHALEAARGLAENDTDEGRLARCFLYLHERNLELEDIYELVERYLHSGMAEREHSRLVTALERVESAAHRRSHEDEDDSLGL